jgi:hypothetical protein
MHIKSRYGMNRSKQQRVMADQHIRVPRDGLVDDGHGWIHGKYYAAHLIAQSSDDKSGRIPLFRIP